MISRDLVEVCSTDSPGITLRVCDREQGERWVPGGRQGTFYLNPIPSCSCCGEPAWENRRCTKHQDRNPCMVEGCKRTVKAGAGQLGDYQAVCGTHWRRYVPPGSRERRLYNRHRARAKRLGWSPERIRAFLRFWDTLAHQIVRRSTEGHLDQAEIERMFGWDKG